MRAAFIEETGSPDVIKVGDLPTPEPGPGQVLVRIRAVALNPFDLVPDVVPLLGVLDDATVIAACMLLVEHELQRWRSSKMLMDE